MLLLQKILVGAIAVQHECLAQLTGETFAGFFIELDELDLIVVLERLGQTFADVAATHDHYALGWLVHTAHLFQHAADILLGGDEEDLIAFFDDGGALWADRSVLAEDRSHAGFDLRHMCAQEAQGFAY